MEIPPELLQSSEVTKLLEEYKAAQAEVVLIKGKIRAMVTFLRETLDQAEVDRKGSQDSGYNESGRWII